MKTYTINQFLEAMKNNEIKPHYAKIIKDYDEELEGFIGFVPSENEEDEHDRLYDLDKCNLEQLLYLIEYCDFELLFHDEKSFNEVKDERDWYNDDAFLTFTLEDLQGANWGNIEGDGFLMKEPTEASFRNMLLDVIDRLEVYLQDYCIQIK